MSKQKYRNTEIGQKLMEVEVTKIVGFLLKIEYGHHHHYLNHHQSEFCIEDSY